MLPGQLSLFESTTAPSTSVRGLLVNLPGTCLCGERTSVIGSSSGPHYARVTCAACDRFRCWMSAETFAFVTTIIDKFGRPVEPIFVRNSICERT
jgi:hypothetical protein